MRTIGRRDRPEPVKGPVEAFHRGRAPDAMLAGAIPKPPRGAWRGSHAALAAEHEARERAAARRVADELLVDLLDRRQLLRLRDG